jgi:hypothetical protein
MKLQSATSTAAGAIRKSLGAVLSHIFDDAEDARYRDMERQIRRLIDQSGGHFSDETERRIAQHLMGNSRFWLD